MAQWRNSKTLSNEIILNIYILFLLSFFFTCGTTVAHRLWPQSILWILLSPIGGIYETLSRHPSRPLTASTTRSLATTPLHLKSVFTESYGGRFTFYTSLHYFVAIPGKRHTGCVLEKVWERTKFNYSQI